MMLSRLLANLEGNSPLLTPAYKTSSLPTHKLTDGFQDVWESHNLVASPALRASWSSIFKAMDDVVELNKQYATEKSIVITEPTGSGKTQSMLYYLASLSTDTQTRALVVTRQKNEAEVLARELTAMTYQGFVGVYNGDKHDIEGASRIKDLDAVEEHPVVIISHARYELAIKRGYQYQQLTQGRDLVCIDEELTMMTDIFISEKQLTITKEILNTITPTSTSIDAIDYLLATERGLILKECGEPIAGTSLEGLRAVALSLGDLDTVIDELKTSDTPISHLFTDVRNEDTSAVMRKNAIATLRSIENIFSSFLYTVNGIGNTTVWVGGELHLPSKCQVVFDATAMTNELYALHEDVMEVRPRVEGTRDYSKVELSHLCSSVGKYSWVENDITSSIQTIVNEVTHNHKEGIDTLVVVHKAVEDGLKHALSSKGILKTEEGGYVYVSHWGAITGLNTWSHCGQLFIFGMNIKPEGFITNRMTAMRGTEFVFNDDFEDEADSNYLPLKQRLELSELMAELVQAMNRVRCRRAIDARGGCDTTQVFVILPTKRGWVNNSIDMITEQMPNIQISDWVSAPRNKDVFKDSKVLGDSIVSKVKSLELDKGESIRIDIVGKMLGFKQSKERSLTEAQQYYRRELALPTTLDALAKIGYEIYGTKNREFRRIR